MHVVVGFVMAGVALDRDGAFDPLVEKGTVGVLINLAVVGYVLGIK